MEGNERVRRRLAAILSADIAGYSRLMGADDAGTFDEMRARRELLRARVSDGGGRVVDAVGDNLLAEFPSTVDAVQCAIAAQQALAERDSALPELRRLGFRIGIHLGEVIVDGHEIAGDGVNVAARLCALADPGGICISAAVAEQLRGKLEPGLEDGGEQRLKNIASPVRVYRVRGKSLPKAEAPARRESPPAIAVLPFENLSGDPAQEYLSDGIAEDLLTRMAGWDLPVIARQSSFAYRGSRKDAREIGRELGVRYLVEGSLRRSGDRIRLAVQLIDAESGGHVFAENFDRELGDVFAVQDEITRAIAQLLGGSVFRHAQARALALAPENVGAYDALLRAGWHHNRGTAPDWHEARRFVRKAIELDPLYSRAHAVLAIIEFSGLDGDWSKDPEQSVADALAAARRSIELDPGEFAGHMAFGMAQFRSGDLAAAQLAFERAVELQPEVASAHGNLGWFLVYSGRFAEAIAALERAIELDRRSSGARVANQPFWHAHLAAAYCALGRDEEALQMVERGLQVGRHPLPLGLRAVILVRLGRLEDARRQVTELPGVTLSLAQRMLRLGEPAFVAQVIEALRQAGMPE